MTRDEALAGLNRLLGTLRYEGDDNREEIDTIKWALDRIAELEAPCPVCKGLGCEDD